MTNILYYMVFIKKLLKKHIYKKGVYKIYIPVIIHPLKAKNPCNQLQKKQKNGSDIDVDK